MKETMIKSRILKGTILFVEIVVFSLIVLIFLLMYGIKLNNISYNDINISQLYIKYDKNLIVNAKNLMIENNSIDINGSIDYGDQHILCNIEKIQYNNAKLELKGDIKLSQYDIKEIINKRKSSLVLENISFIYDKNIKPLKAKKLFLEYKNNNLYISFKEPRLDGIKLDKSTIILKNLDQNLILDLELYSDTLLNSSLQNILNYYDITIPVVQKSGRNDIFVQLSIPFDNLSKTNAFVKVKSNNGKVDMEGTIVEYKDLDIVYKDNSTKIISQSGKIDFKQKIFTYKNLQGDMANNILIIDANLSDTLNNLYNLGAQTNFNTLITKANIDIKNFAFEHYILVKDKKVSVVLENKKDGIVIKNKELGLIYSVKNNQHILEIKNFNKIIDYTTFATNKNNNKSSFSLVSNDDLKHIDINLDDLYITIDSTKLWKKTESKKSNLPFIKLYSNEGNITYDKNDIVYNQFYMENSEERFLFDSYIVDKLNNKYIIDLYLNNENQKFDGNLIFLGVNYNDLMKTGTLACDFSGKIDKNSTQIKSDYLDMSYTNENEKHTIVINNLKRLLGFFPDVKVYQENKNSNLKLETLDNFKSSQIVVNNVELDYNSSRFTQSSKDSQLNLPRLDIRAFDSFVHYDNFDINTSVLESQMSKENINIQLIPSDKQGQFFVKKINDKLTIEAKELSSNFVNTLFKKDRFEKGSFSGKLTGDMKHLKGKAYIDGSTVKDVAVINNLITFVNTTPALYNPILALPTLFRLGETGFDLNGYYVKHGEVTLEIDVDKKMMKMPYFKTNSKMTDFKGNGWVDFENKTMHFSTDIIFLKDFSKAVNHIPLVNYIILGKDGNFVTQVDINGTFEKQEYETHTVKNASNGVINIIKRVISIPFLPFMNDSNSSTPLLNP